jgi:hypothetical protein
LKAIIGADAAHFFNQRVNRLAPAGKQAMIGQKARPNSS